jgi:hypothetical protein
LRQKIDLTGEASGMCRKMTAMAMIVVFLSGLAARAKP